MIFGIQRIYIFGCLLSLLAAGCESPQSPAVVAPPPQNVLISANGDTQVVSNAQQEAVILNKNTTFPYETPIRQYDEPLISKIIDQWGEHIDVAVTNGLPAAKGETIIWKFRLHSDGTISDISAVQPSPSEMLNSICKNAISAASPYKPWPQEMKKIIGQESRIVTMTFRY